PIITLSDEHFSRNASMNAYHVNIKDFQTGRITRIGNAKTVDLDMALFAPPADYTERGLSFQ
ncbi:MAG: hypothetical protein P8Y94_12275, partial [Acidobacteriota bacterium]